MLAKLGRDRLDISEENEWAMVRLRVTALVKTKVDVTGLIG